MNLVQRDTVTREECAEALRRLTDSDLQRLEQLARLRVIGLHAVEWRELLHEAVVRLLDGSRQWPREVPLVVFLRETMRSIASDHWRRLERPVVVAESELGPDSEADGGVVANARDEKMQPERRASAEETLARIEKLFTGDDEALHVLVGMAYGRSPKRFSRRPEWTRRDTRALSGESVGVCGEGLAKNKR